MSDFLVQIGSANEGKTFVRVVHVPTGKDRIVVGLEGADPRAVEARLTEELSQEIGAKKGVVAGSDARS